MCFFYGLDVSKWTVLLVICESAVIFPVLGMAPKINEVLQFLKIDRKALNLVQSCQRMY